MGGGTDGNSAGGRLGKKKGPLLNPTSHSFNIVRKKKETQKGGGQSAAVVFTSPRSNRKPAQGGGGGGGGLAECQDPGTARIPRKEGSRENEGINWV